MDTPQFPGETTPPFHSGQQRFPTLRHCLEQFLDAAPAYYVREEQTSAVLLREERVNVVDSTNAPTA